MSRSGRGKHIGKGRGNWNVTHGDSKRSGRAPEYGVWHQMMRRCNDPRCHNYLDYGGRGITVCSEWTNYSTFIADMGRRPSPKHTIERVNNDLGYHPGNCIWADRKTQARNRRKRTKKTHCKHGHEFTEQNTYVYKNGKRSCIKCRKIAIRKLQDKGYFREWQRRKKLEAA